MPRNDEYCILKSFAVLEQTPGVPGLDIPGFDAVSIAKAYGCDAARLTDLEAIKKAALEAWSKSKTTVLEIPVPPPSAATALTLNGVDDPAQARSLNRFLQELFRLTYR